MRDEGLATLAEEAEKQQSKASALAAGQERVDRERLAALTLTGGQIAPVAMTHRDAELRAAAWMVGLAFVDARATPVGADPGIDVTSACAYAQVKHWRARVGRKHVQNIHGVATADGRQAFLFALESDVGHYGAQAIAWGERHGVAMFAYTPTGNVSALTTSAKALVAGRPQA